jgi:hypothetical protein
MGLEASFTVLDKRSFSTEVLALFFISDGVFLEVERDRAELDFFATRFERGGGAIRRVSSSEDVSESLSLLFYTNLWLST